MHIKLKHPGAKIPNSYTSPTLNSGVPFYPPRISPYVLGQYGSNLADLPKELIYNATQAQQQQQQQIQHQQQQQQAVAYGQAGIIPAQQQQYQPAQPIYSKSPRTLLPNNLALSLSGGLIDSPQVQQQQQQPEPTPQVYKFSDLPAISLRIGAWEKQSNFCGDLVARFSYTERKFMWEIFNQAASLTKMEIYFDDISSMDLRQLSDDRVELTFTVSQAPHFFEAKFDTQAAMTYKACNDFTGGEATTGRTHSLCFVRNALANPLDALAATDPKFRIFVDAANLNLHDVVPSSSPKQQMFISQSTPVPVAIQQQLPYLDLERVPVMPISLTPADISPIIAAPPVIPSPASSTSSTSSLEVVNYPTPTTPGQQQQPPQQQQSFDQQQQQSQQNHQQQLYYNKQHSSSSLGGEVPELSGDATDSLISSLDQPAQLFASSDLSKCFNDIALCSPAITGMPNNPAAMVHRDQPTL
ncbi:hypothetical protein SAMD00019534_094720 [Acytostelium subglobosum LB1]|uniref:hypothetical protein n=1 Tax=Acytostelium subglobosum LB1 TaxID=1410327 RepID=UPI0006450313|nr:hypothetical protein SAMD00019534_094720 [Acytostelium subglobosum LB1]GAM26297.1 hypothetical protein SAMD00019534_094720 [Acytostelium subglobosum LB1]|eukprot:XP_012750851.1 hypothetical protein SAMD00019534_094720 [Acytostelium subglobosum LB1]